MGRIAILEMKSAEEAQKLIKGLDNTPMDKSHTFHLYKYADIVACLEDQDETALPSKESYPPLVKASTVMWDLRLLVILREGLHNWMKDSQQRDQFLVRHQNRTEIFWSDVPEPVCVNNGEKDDISASLDTVRWTPLGSYLFSFHAKGVILRGGDNFVQCARFPHTGVREMDFSSQERYAVSWNGQMGVTNREAVCVWEVPSGQLLRKFPCTEPVWPSFAFSADEQFLASKGSNGIGM